MDSSFMVQYCQTGALLCNLCYFYKRIGVLLNTLGDFIERNLLIF